MYSLRVNLTFLIEFFVVCSVQSLPIFPLSRALNRCTESIDMNNHPILYSINRRHNKSEFQFIPSSTLNSLFYLNFLFSLISNTTPNRTVIHSNSVENFIHFHWNMCTPQSKAYELKELSVCMQNPLLLLIDLFK